MRKKQLLQRVVELSTRLSEFTSRVIGNLKDKKFVKYKYTIIRHS